jgi:hypothetical protein
MKSDYVLTVSKRDTLTRRLSRTLFDALPVNKDGTRGCSHLEEINEKPKVSKVQEEITDFLERKKSEQSCCGKHDDCKKAEPIEPVIEPVNDELPEAEEPATVIEAPAKPKQTRTRRVKK